MFLTIFNKKKIADKLEMGKINNIFYKLLEGVTKFILATPRKTERVGKNLNLPIDDRRKIKLPYE